MNKTLTVADLVSFGNYLLSKEREKMIINKDNLTAVTDADLANWMHLQENGEEK